YLHWVNDLPGYLAQIHRCLKPDGLFLGSLLGQDTSSELRQSLMQAELELCNGASPRVSPFAGLQDMAELMQRAGFALPVIDMETVQVTYRHLVELLRDLQNMGEANA
ncbi:MAG TPA: methyltransferase domain-containing protein, partial [Alphaproteobacteria bacterium]|nr:methyltransferase domain-containing protein [Alphaproteobacteria bacterium]